jgi:DNA polymerase-3 subunit delta'
LPRLLPTLRSRCRKVAMPSPRRDEAARWLAGQGVADAAGLLALAGYAPLLARELAEEGALARHEAFIEAIAAPERLDPIALAEEFKAHAVAETVGWLQKWLYDLASVRLAGEARYHPAKLGTLGALARRVAMPRLLALQRELLAAQAAAEHPLNSQLVLEGLLFSLANLTDKK